jgi:hypothetical protein
MFILKKSVGAVVQDINESIVTHITILKLIHGCSCMSNEIPFRWILKLKLSIAV